MAEEAAVLADEVGLGKLNLTALADRLGVRQPSLYNHIESLAGLHRDIAVRAKRDLGEVLARASVGRSGPDAISAMSYAYRDWALRHPARYAASNLMPAPGDIEDEAVSISAIQVITDVLTAYRLEGDDAVDAIRAFRSSLHGFVSYETAGAFRWSADVNRSFDRLVRGFIVALNHWADTTSPYPAPRPPGQPTHPTPLE